MSDIVMHMKEAFKYIKMFKDKVFVIKLSGKLIEDDMLLSSIAEDIALLDSVGIHVIVVHGGGVQIDVELKKKGIEKRMIDGLRVTDRQTLEVVREVLQKMNKNIAHAIEQHRCTVARFDGSQHALVRARKKKADVDYGFVGDVVSIDTAALHRLLAQDTVPVVACLGADTGGQVLNINADEIALAIAKEMKAEKLMLLGDVPGILRDMDDRSSLISSLSVKEARQLIDQGIISGGMIPKVKVMIQAMQYVNETHMIDGIGDSLLLEVFTDKGTGTVIVR